MNPALRVAVVIPCLNEQAYIGACVQSVLDSDYPASLLSIRVCDGFSTDGTRELVQQLAARHPQVLLVDNPERVTPIALNRGIEAGEADVYIILGAHAAVARDFVRLNVETLQAHPEAGCVGGVLDNVSEDARTASIARAMSSSFGVGNAHFRTGAREGWVDTVAFGAYRAEVIATVGLFNPVLVRNQDDEYNFRVLKAGYRIYLNPSIRATYYVRSSFARLFRQYRQYGYWKVYVNHDHRTVTTLRQLVPPLWVLYLVPGFAISLLHPLLRIAWLAGFLAYVLLSLRSAAQVAKGDALSVCRAFYILHFSYGLGYLEGFWDFVLLRKKPGGQHTRLSR
jgi:GT2 family glycosyltransferase